MILAKIGAFGHISGKLTRADKADTGDFSSSLGVDAITASMARARQVVGA
jgi:hypothetical protein